MRQELPLGHPQFGRLAPCKCAGELLLQKRQKASRLSESERQITLDKLVTANRPDTAKMVAAVRAFLENPVGFLTIHGNFGTGKTACLMAIVNQSIRQEYEAIYITLFDLLGYVREAYSKDEESDWVRLNRLTAVHILCIDELDKVKETEWMRQTMTHVFDVRYRDGMTGRCGTVWAFNGGFDGIEHPWIRSRLMEGVIIENNDPDIRPFLRSK